MKDMKFRRVHVELGFWEDADGFELTDSAIMYKLAKDWRGEKRGAHVHAHTESVTIYQVMEVGAVR